MLDLLENLQKNIMENRQETWVCDKCVHFRILSGGCDAFPNGIPNSVLVANEHSNPIRGQDNDIVFELGDPGLK